MNMDFEKCTCGAEPHVTDACDGIECVNPECENQMRITGKIPYHAWLAWNEIFRPDDKAAAPPATKPEGT